MSKPWIFEVFKDKKGEWRYRLIATNGNITNGPQEGYKRRGEVGKAIYRLQHNAPTARIVVLEDGMRVEWPGNGAKKKK